MNSRSMAADLIVTALQEITDRHGST